MKRFLIILIFLPMFSYGQVKVSEMTSASSVNDADIFLLVQSGSSKKVAYSVFKYTSVEAATQISDSLDNYATQTALEDSSAAIRASVAGVSYGAIYQIPTTNAGTDGFNYSSSLAWNGVNLNLNTGTNNIFIGEGTGIANTGLSNLFIGYQSGNNNLSGQTNVFLGNYSGQSNTTGSSNLFSGYNSGNFNTTGSWNTFNGFDAGGSNTTGSSNSFYGYQSGLGSISGVKNLFFGAESAYNNLTGNNNIVNGYQSGYLGTGYSSCVFIGYQSGYSNLGDNNIYIGSESGYSGGATSLNTYIGYKSGYLVATGGENTFSGAYSGYSNLIGERNTYIGNYTGYNSIGSNNVFLGYQAGQNETGSNKLYISNSTSDTLIYGEFDNDIVHLNADVTIDGDIFADNLIPISATQYQIPYVSSSGSGFDFSSNLAWNDTTLELNFGTSNIFIGNNSGNSITTGFKNTFVGFESGFSNTLGNNNSYFGYSSGKSNIDGVQNVFLGFESGFNNNGSSNIFIGYKSAYNETGSNKLYIENSNSTDPLIYGEFDNNYVKINDSLEIARSLKFSQNDVEEYSQGKEYYDTVDQALNFYNDIPNFTHSLGYEHVVRFYNNTGGTLVNGTLLRSTGAKVNGSIVFTADLAGNARLDSMQGIAMATVDVDDGEYGIATLIGQVNGLNTSMFNTNDLLWVGHEGGYVSASPDPPLWSTIFGRVVYADNDSGAIYMFPVGETRYSPNPTFTARFEDSTEVITNPGLGTYESITSATGSLFGEIRNVGFTFQGDSISPQQDGNYTVFFSYSFQGTAAQTDLYRIGVFVNGVKQYSTSRTASGANNGGVPFPYSAFLTAGDWISFRITNLSDASRDCTFTDGTITINFSE